jgi:hypothetical protein
MANRKPATRVAQAWVELISDDPEALSALGVARARLAAGRDLERLRRVRLIELEGALPARERIEALLHGSTQFYNPHKERCSIRLAGEDPVPLDPEERAVLVFERDGIRRPAAERWWRHQTGDSVEVREGVVWALGFGAEHPSRETVEELALVRGREQGLLSNPHSQGYRVANERIPVPWLTTATDPEEGRRGRRKPAKPPRRKR